MASRENIISASTYVLTFFRDVEEVTNQVGHYNNMLLDFKSKYGVNSPIEEILKSLDDGDKVTALKVTQTTRFWVNRVYLKLSAMQDHEGSISDHWQEIEDSAKTIKENTIPTLQDVERFGRIVNKLFVIATFRALFDRASSFYNEYSAKGDENPR